MPLFGGSPGTGVEAQLTPNYAAGAQGYAPAAGGWTAAPGSSAYSPWGLAPGLQSQPWGTYPGADYSAFGASPGMYAPGLSSWGGLSNPWAAVGQMPGAYNPPAPLGSGTPDNGPWSGPYGQPGAWQSAGLYAGNPWQQNAYGGYQNSLAYAGQTPGMYNGPSAPLGSGTPDNGPWSGPYGQLGAWQSAGLYSANPWQQAAYGGYQNSPSYPQYGGAGWGSALAPSLPTGAYTGMGNMWQTAGPGYSVGPWQQAPGSFGTPAQQGYLPSAYAGAGGAANPWAAAAQPMLTPRPAGFGGGLYPTQGASPYNYNPYNQANQAPAAPPSPFGGSLWGPSPSGATGASDLWGAPTGGTPTPIGTPPAWLSSTGPGSSAANWRDIQSWAATSGIDLSTLLSAARSSGALQQMKAAGAASAYRNPLGW